LLPASITIRREDSVPPEPEARVSLPARRARVLVVDDELALGTTLMALLRDEHDMTAVTTGRDALDLLLGPTEFDVVLCDLMMPGVSGMDIFDELLKQRPGYERRIVFMTGGAFTPRATTFLAEVPNRSIEKPFDLGALRQVLREVAWPGGATLPPDSRVEEPGTPQMTPVQGTPVGQLGQLRR
jgi:CheY-like chemotaxis protein